jgi:orotate phosphoribosyltransferase-like protein
MLQLAPDRTVAQTPDAEMPEVNTEQTIYRDIEALAGQGMSLENISEELKVPKGEVELVLKLKRLSAESAKNKNNPPA